MKYIIAGGVTVEQLELEVNRLMEQGWQPIGGIAAVSKLQKLSNRMLGQTSSTTESLYQAMIYRPAPKPPEIPG